MAERDLDGWIYDALREEAAARPPGGAWDRLRRVLVERRRHRYGMWVLDETQREPRELVPTKMTRRQRSDAARLHGWSLQEYKWEVREAMWGTMLPTFTALLNW